MLMEGSNNNDYIWGRRPRELGRTEEQQEQLGHSLETATSQCANYGMSGSERQDSELLSGLLEEMEEVSLAARGSVTSHRRNRRRRRHLRHTAPSPENTHADNLQFPSVHLVNNNNPQAQQFAPGVLVNGMYASVMTQTVLPYSFDPQAWAAGQLLLFSPPAGEYVVPGSLTLPAQAPPIPQMRYAPYVNYAMTMGVHPHAAVGHRYDHTQDEVLRTGIGISSPFPVTTPQQVSAGPYVFCANNVIPAFIPSHQSNWGPAASADERRIPQRPSRGRRTPSYRCRVEQCNYFFSRRNDRDRHEVVHDPHRTALICEACGGKFTRRDTMLQHQRRSCPGSRRV